jgi:hypothetical protein
MFAGLISKFLVSYVMRHANNGVVLMSSLLLMSLSSRTHSRDPAALHPYYRILAILRSRRPTREAGGVGYSRVNAKTSYDVSSMSSENLKFSIIGRGHIRCGVKCQTDSNKGSDAVGSCHRSSHRDVYGSI